MVHPIVTRVFAEKDRQGITYDELAERAGIAKSGLLYWKSGERTPGLVTLDAALEVLGLELAVVPRKG